MKKNDNLKPFKKGKSGNPAGRPKGAVSMTTRLKNILEKRISNYNPIEKIIKKDKIINHLVDVLIAKGLSGEDKAIIEIFNRIDGKVKEQIESIVTNIEIGKPPTQEEAEWPDEN